MKYYRDLKNSLDTSREEGKIEGKFEIAKKLIAMGFDDNKISEATGLPIEEIKNLKNQK